MVWQKEAIIDLEETKTMSKGNRDWYINTNIKKILEGMAIPYKGTTLKDYLEAPLKELGMEWMEYGLNTRGHIYFDKTGGEPGEHGNIPVVKHVLDKLEAFPEIQEKATQAKQDILKLEKCAQSENLYYIYFEGGVFGIVAGYNFKGYEDLSQNEARIRLNNLKKIDPKNPIFSKKEEQEFKLKLAFRDEQTMKKLDKILHTEILFLEEKMNPLSEMLDEKVRVALEKMEKISLEVDITKLVKRHCGLE